MLNCPGQCFSVNRLSLPVTVICWQRVPDSACNLGLAVHWIRVLAPKSLNSSRSRRTDFIIPRSLSSKVISSPGAPLKCTAISFSNQVITTLMDERWIKRYCLVAMLVSVSGCAQTQFSASDLPSQYVAAPIRNYSTVDFTPFAKAIVNDNTIQEGDLLEVSLDTGIQGEDSTLEWDVSVDGAGQATLPNIGPIKLAGLERAEAAQLIVNTSLARDVFLTPTVGVSVKEKVEKTVLVSGAVTQPGLVTVRGEKVTLADVLARAGGVTSDASGEISVTGSNGRSAIPNAIRAVGSSNDAGLDAISISLAATPPEQLGEMYIADGSVVHVEETPPRPIKVVGVIKDQAIEVPSGLNVRLLDALTLAGGQTYSNWISDKVTIIRRVPSRNETIRIKASIRRAKADAVENILLAPYDIVSVEENIVTFTLSTLSGLFGAGASAAQIGAL